MVESPAPPLGHSRWGWRPRSVSTEVLANFCRRLHCLVTSGVSVHAALGGMKDGEVPALREALEEIVASVESGQRLSRALARHPHLFSTLFIYLVAAGEESGRLPDCLGNLTDLLERSSRLQRQLLAALVYPFLVLLFTLALLLFMALVIFPKEEAMYASLGTELPWLTQAMTAGARFLVNPFVLVVAAAQIVLLAATWNTWGRTWYEQSLRRHVDRTLLKLPVLGSVLEKVATTRMLAGLGTLLQSGLVLTQTRVVGKLSGNSEIDARYDRFLERVRAGSTLGQALDEANCFPVLVRHLFRLGEEHGQLDTVLHKTSLAYDEEVEIALATLTALLEPLAIAFMGLTVGSVVLASVLPTLTMLQHLS